jgi:hypothetical protein
MAVPQEGRFLLWAQQPFVVCIERMTCAGHERDRGFAAGAVDGSAESSSGASFTTSLRPVPPRVSGVLAAREKPTARSSCSSTSKEDT